MPFRDKGGTSTITQVFAVLTILILSGFSQAAMKVKSAKTYAVFEKIILKAEDVSSLKAQFLWDVDGECDYHEAGETLYVWAKPGKYKVKLTAIDFDTKKVERATFTFEVTGKAPDPNPNPNPDPTPVPAPETPLEKDLRLAYEGDTDPKKSENVKLLTSLYKQLALVELKDVKTAGELNTILRTASGKILPLDAVKKVREAITPKLKEVLPSTPDAELTQDHKAAALNLFDKIGKALEKLK